ncbi:multi-sensor hybrid histidine kinase [Stylonychia lemnae]|uniref:Multi-sensor hybrid histidine kinase n=1 Tax=Stylonychia lemnae TaxID=5949 RepID=A0A077ZS99_STYLE|nr:multi-sensor hybrid histidine kinase [Stylonychia lemnae]|eukprot:CDW71321.1 multi-sensor hybrid histidine kinase [Stylonychia lemnae]
MEHLNICFKEAEYKLFREKEQKESMRNYHYLSFITVGFLVIIAIIKREFVLFTWIRLGMTTFSVLSSFFLAKYRPRQASFYEMILNQPMFVIVSFMRCLSVSTTTLYYHPIVAFQQLYNFLVLQNSTLGWFPKTVSYACNQILYFSLFYWKYGNDGSMMQMPAFAMLIVSFVGISLRRNEELMRIDLATRTQETFLREKIQKILLLIQDGVLIINQMQDDKEIVYENDTLKKIRKMIKTKFSSYQLRNGSQAVSQENQLYDSDRCLRSDDSYQQQEILLDSLFENLQFRYEFSNNKEKIMTFPEWIKKIRSNKSFENQTFFFKLEPIGFSIQIYINYLEKEGQILIVFKELSAFKKLQKTKNREKFTNIFINSTAHNVYTPLNGLIGITQLIEMEMNKMPTVVSSIRIMKTCIYNLFYTTQNIIEHSRIRLKKFIPEIQEVRIFDIISKQIEIFKNDAFQKDIELIKTINCEEVICVDEARLNLIIFNILSNSIKFTESGHIEVIADIISSEELQERIEANQLAVKVEDIHKIYMKGNTQYLYLSVIDTGVGMNVSKHDELFNLFQKFRVSEDNINQQGLGLGLSVSNLICQQLNGNIFLEWTRKSKGSKFSFYIPVQVISDEFLNAIEIDNYLDGDDTTKYNSTENYTILNQKLDRNKLIQKELESATKNLQFNVTITSVPSNEICHVQYSYEDIYEELIITAKSDEKSLTIPTSKILVVDDTVFNVEIISMLLQQLFAITIDSAYSGQQAIQRIIERIENINQNPSQQMYSLILMDINMSGMDGVQATKIIRNRFGKYISNHCRIYAYTAIPQSQFGDYSQKGFDGFLPKPLNHQILQKVLIDLKII